MVPPEETSAIVPGLEEGKDYEFRVVPVNAAGPGEASDPTASIFTKARKGLCTVPPPIAHSYQCSLTRTNCSLLVIGQL